MLKLISHNSNRKRAPKCAKGVCMKHRIFVPSYPESADTKGAASRATLLVALVLFRTKIHVSLTASAVHLPKTMQREAGQEPWTSIAHACLLVPPRKKAIEVVVSYYLTPTSHQLGAACFRLLGVGSSSPKRVRILLSSS